MKFGSRSISARMSLRKGSECRALTARSSKVVSGRLPVAVTLGRNMKYGPNLQVVRISIARDKLHPDWNVGVFERTEVSLHNFRRVAKQPAVILCTVPPGHKKNTGAHLPGQPAELLWFIKNDAKKSMHVIRAGVPQRTWLFVGHVSPDSFHGLQFSPGRGHCVAANIPLVLQIFLGFRDNEFKLIPDPVFGVFKFSNKIGEACNFFRKALARRVASYVDAEFKCFELTFHVPRFAKACFQFAQKGGRGLRRFPSIREFLQLLSVFPVFPHEFTKFRLGGEDEVITIGRFVNRTHGALLFRLFSTKENAPHDIGQNGNYEPFHQVHQMPDYSCRLTLYALFAIVNPESLLRAKISIFFVSFSKFVSACVFHVGVEGCAAVLLGGAPARSIMIQTRRFQQDILLLFLSTKTGTLA